MVQIVFYEKPGCINNRRQKQLLAAAGHDLVVRNLLTTAWTAESLSPFFQGLAVADWFNRSAPAVKAGALNPETPAADAALALMLQDRLLIRRPLMVIEGRHWVGFDADALAASIGLAPVEDAQDLERCPRSHAAGSCAHQPVASQRPTEG